MGCRYPFTRMLLEAKKCDLRSVDAILFMDSTPVQVSSNYELGQDAKLVSDLRKNGFHQTMSETRMRKRNWGLNFGEDLSSDTIWRPVSGSTLSVLSTLDPGLSPFSACSWLSTQLVECFGRCPQSY